MPSFLASYDDKNSILEITIVGYYISHDILRQIKTILRTNFSVASESVCLKEQKSQ